MAKIYERMSHEIPPAPRLSGDMNKYSRDLTLWCEIIVREHLQDITQLYDRKIEGDADTGEIDPVFLAAVVTAWQVTPDNTHVPSEKLVKDSLNGKEPTLTKGNLTASSPLAFNNTRQVIGGAADISIASTALPHLAYCKANAGAATTIVCYLDTDGTGTEITVNCHIAGGGNLDSAIPRLTDGLGIVVIYIGSSWYCATVFQASINCVCTSP